MKTIPKSYILLLLGLYLSQFAGYGFFMEAFITILRKNGLGLQYLGLIYMLALFTVLRFIWAPYIDKIEFSKRGHYKGWLYVTQILISLCYIVLSLCDFKQHLPIVLVFIGIFSFLAATQYAAMDGFIYKTLSKEQRSVGNAIKIAGGMLGTILGSGLGLMFYAHLGWQYTIWIFTAIALASMLLLSLYSEEEIQRQDDLNPIRLRDIFRYLSDKQRRTWLTLVVLSPIPISIFYGFASRILVDKDWSLDKIGFVVNVIGYSVGAIVPFFVPFFIKKIGKRNVLYIGIIGQIIGLGLLLFVLNGLTGTIFVGLIISFTYAFYPLGATVVATLMMDNITSNTPAFEYAIQHSVNMFIGILSVGLALFIAGFIGYSGIIYIGIFMGIVSLIPAKKIQMD